MSSFPREPFTSSSYPSTPNGTSSANTSVRIGFFELPVTLAAQALLLRVQGQAGGIAWGHNKLRRSTSQSRTRDRDVGGAHVGMRAPSSRPLPVIGSGDWNASRTSLWLAVGLCRESVMENSPSPSRPSSPLPPIQEVSARKTQVSYSGRRPSTSGTNTRAAAAEAQTPMTPSKLFNWKSLGFVRLGFCRGIAHATEGKHLGLGLALGPHAADSDDEEDYGHQQQRTRQK